MAQLPANDYLTLHEIIQQARLNLGNHAWHYIVGGAETETTMRRNRWSIDRLALRPRVLCDVGDTDAGIDWFGRRLRLPILFAPVGGLEHFWEGGPIPVTQAAEEFGVPHMLSSVCACSNCLNLRFASRWRSRAPPVALIWGVVIWPSASPCCPPTPGERFPC